jgi:hypothetical protein
VIDWLLRKTVGRLAAVWHRRRLLREKPAPWVNEFREMFPGRCMVCSYTDHARDFGTDLKPIVHRCPEGRGDGPPNKLPRARVVSR